MRYKMKRGEFPGALYKTFKMCDIEFMKRALILFAFFVTGALFAQIPGQDAGGAPAAAAAEQGPDDIKPGFALLNNEFFIRSMKEKNLARLKLDEGEYDESAFHAAEAEKYARLSDEYIAKMLLIAKVNRAIVAAGDHISWAKRSEAATYYPEELNRAEAHYSAAIELKKTEDWENSLENALAVAADLAGIAAPPEKGKPPKDLPPNPAQYKVRPWDIFGDCFWNIAYWFYKDYFKWPVIYRANRDKIPDPDNPDLIEVGTVIDIPVTGGETRVGMYDTGRPYKP